MQYISALTQRGKETAQEKKEETRKEARINHTWFENSCLGNACECVAIHMAID